MDKAKRAQTVRLNSKVPGPPLTIEDLTPRQVYIRQRLVEGLGHVDETAVARELGVGRIVVVRELRVIKQIAPVRPPEFDEKIEIGKVIDFYESALDLALDELGRLDDAEDMVRNGSLQTSPSKIGLFNSIARLRRDFNEFLFDTGWIPRAPQIIGYDDDTLAALTTQDAIKAEIKRVNADLATLRRAKSKARDRDDRDD